MSGSDWGMLLVLSLLWGGSFYFVEIAIAELPPLSLVFLRAVLAAIVLWSVVACIPARLPRGPGTLLNFTVSGLMNFAIPFCLIVWGQIHITSGLASILNATTPLFTVVVAGALLADERISRAKVVGLVLGFTGTIFMIGPSAFSGLGKELWAQLACLGGALSFAFGAVFARRFARLGISPVVTAAGQASAAAIVLLPLVVLFDQPWNLEAPATSTWAAVIGLAVFSTGLGHVIYFRILATAGATNVLVATFLVPVTAILLGVLFLNEHLQAGHLTGFALIGLGLIAIDGRLWRRIRQ